MRGRCAVAGLVVAAVLVAGCGAEEFPNDPRPPAPVELSAKIDDRKVVVVPEQDRRRARVVHDLQPVRATTSSSTSRAEQRRDRRDPRRRHRPASSSSSRPGDYTIEPSVPTIRRRDDDGRREAPERPERPAAALTGRWRRIRLASSSATTTARSTSPAPAASCRRCRSTGASSRPRAAAALDERAAGYVFGSAGTGATDRANREALDAWRIVPRMLRDIAVRDLRSSARSAAEWPAPLATRAGRGRRRSSTPTASSRAPRRRRASGVPVHGRDGRRAHDRGDRRASSATRRGMFQLYWPNDPELAESFVDRAEARRLRGDRGHRRQRVPRLEAARPPERLPAGDRGDRPRQLLRRPGLPRRRSSGRPRRTPGPAIGKFIGVFGNPSLTWDDLDWLRARTSLPILLKGILHPDDAREARERGVDGVVVSNHGGRQVDGAIASLDALPPIAGAVGDELTVLFDSGIRSGADAFKALALGADAVLVGRPYLWGMALEGADGVEKVLRWIAGRARPDHGPVRLHHARSSSARACCRARLDRARRARPASWRRPRRRASRCARASPRTRLDHLVETAARLVGGGLDAGQGRADRLRLLQAGDGLLGDRADLAGVDRELALAGHRDPRQRPAGRRCASASESGSSRSTATISLLPSYSCSCSRPAGTRSSPATTSTPNDGGAGRHRGVELRPRRRSWRASCP